MTRKPISVFKRPTTKKGQFRYYIKLWNENTGAYSTPRSATSVALELGLNEKKYPPTSKTGCSPDNAACEGLFGRIKNELFYNRNWIGVTMDSFIELLNKYLQWYNTARIKMTLGGKSPVQYRLSLGLVA
jgi:hypothetical protein